MLTFKTILLFTVLLLFPVLIAFRNMLCRPGSMFFQMIFGYIGCYFMKNFYALLNRAVNGIENDRLEMDWVAMLAAISFLIAAWSCLCNLSGEDKEQIDILKRKLKVFLLVGIIAVLAENFAGIAGKRMLFIACYLISAACAYAAAIITGSCPENFQENIKKR